MIKKVFDAVKILLTSKKFSSRQKFLTEQRVINVPKPL